MGPKQGIGISFLLKYRQQGSYHLSRVAISTSILSSDNIAHASNVQLCPANAYPAIIDAQMGHESAILLNDPGLLWAVTRIVQVKRFKVAPGKPVLCKQ